MAALKNIQSLKFGRLEVLEYVGSSKWKCLCDCGAIRIVWGKSLRSGDTKSCGCWAIERTKQVNTKHGFFGSRIYECWHAMKQRCLNPNNKKYEQYSKLGIDPKWLSFENFYEDMSSTYSDELTIERVDNLKGYSKDNCKWATRREQVINREKYKSSSRYIGVCWVKGNKKWRATIKVSGKSLHIGLFINEEDAAKARDKYIVTNGLPNRRNFNG